MELKGEVPRSVSAGAIFCPPLTSEEVGMMRTMQCLQTVTTVIPMSLLCKKWHQL